MDVGAAVWGLFFWNMKVMGTLERILEYFWILWGDGKHGFTQVGILSVT